MNGYDLSRDWFDWCFENPDLVTPNHAALYFFCIEHCNRQGWAKKFGLPMEMAKSAIGIKNYKTYSKTFNDLIEWGFIQLIERSKNQYSANIVAIVKNTKATTKALSKAMQKHSQKQVHGIVGIYKPNNIEPLTIEPDNEILPGTILQQLSNAYKETFPNFLDDSLRDFEPLRLIAEFIAKNILKVDRFIEHPVDILREWKAICLVIKEGEFYAGSPLSTINKQIQKFTNGTGKNNKRVNTGGGQLASTAIIRPDKTFNTSL
jgi:hypothetical protein